MNISLTPRLEKVVRDKVESGLYNNASEVVREAIRKMDAEDQAQFSARFDSALAAGISQIEAGNTVPWTSDRINRALARGRELLDNRTPLDPDVAPLD